MMSFLYRDSALIPQDTIVEHAKTADEYRSFLLSISRLNDYSVAESSLQLPFDYGTLERVQAVVREKKTTALKYVVVVGIGGSLLGSQAVYQALRGELAYLTNHFPALVYLDTVSSSRLDRVAKLLGTVSAEEVVFVVISKSGNTTETMANWEALRGTLQPSMPQINDRTILITNAHSKLWDLGMSMGLTVVTIPEPVGGRYSVFSAVGLLPLALVGVDINAFMHGGQQSVLDMTEGLLEKNHALVSATITYEHWAQGKIIHNSFFFNPECEDLGKWYRQLMGESVGKEKDEEGEVVHRGITPIVSIGSTDLHSMAQLYLGGPRDKFTSFFYHIPSQSPVVPSSGSFNHLVEGIGGKTLSDIMQAIIGGVLSAYREHHLPYTTITTSTLSAETIGYYLQFRMAEMMYLAHLMHVNAFDQPNVEDYKRETRHLLTGNGS